MGLKKKKGSTLIIAIMAVGFLAMVSAIVLSISLSDQKLRIQESNNTKNLYSSESGIEVAYKILEGVVKEAVKLGNQSVEEIKNDVNNEINKAKLEERNNAYNKFFKESYSKYIEENLKNKIEEGDYSSAMVEGDIPKVFIYSLNKDKEVFNIELTSNFTSTKAVNKGSKTINVIYKVKIPEYNRIIKVVENKNYTIPQYNIINNIITCDGDLSVNNEGSVRFDGDIWVKGKPKEKGEVLINPAYYKYKGGIDLSGGGSTYMYGNIMTAATFRANCASPMGIDGNGVEGKLYAGNFYIGKENPGDSDLTYETRKVNANNSAIYLSNDLCINYSRTSLTLGKLYGLNDKNYEENGIRYRNSSAIIINSTDIGAEYGKTNLTVSKEAYLMGTAYINTHPDYYQTGESVGIKGNYKAYTNEINSEKFKNGIFEYRAPLQLITKFSNGDELGLKDKIEYIDLYNKNNKNELDNKGIILKGNVKSVGAYYDSQGKLVKGNYNDEDRGVIDKKRQEFASKVLMMGTKATLKDFEDGEVKKTVENQFNWDNIKTIVDKRGNVIDNTLILNEDESKEIVIEVRKNTVKIKLNNEEIKSYVSNDNGPVFLVISKGNVRYEINEARYRLTCSVIAKGDVKVNINSGVTSIGNYENSANPIVTNGVNEIIKKHFNDIFKNIFSKEAATNSSINTIIETEYEIENPATVKDLIVKERWKLEK